MKRIRRLLEEPLFLPEISGGCIHQRLHDDTDGEQSGRLMVWLNDVGDVLVSTDLHHDRPLRFRNYFGGGRSPRVWNALRYLALAMKLDNEEKPDP